MIFLMSAQQTQEKWNNLSRIEEKSGRKEHLDQQLGFSYI